MTRGEDEVINAYLQKAAITPDAFERMLKDGNPAAATIFAAAKLADVIDKVAGDIIRELESR